MKRGRGQPPKLVGDQLDAVCKLLRQGARIEDAAKQVGVAQATVHNTRKRGGAAGEAIDEAIAAARAERREQRHGHESCYTHHGCRLPQCVAAASAARARRRHTPHPTAPDPAVPAAVVPRPVDTAALYELVTAPPLLADAG